MHEILVFPTAVVSVFIKFWTFEAFLVSDVWINPLIQLDKSTLIVPASFPDRGANGVIIFILSLTRFLMFCLDPTEVYLALMLPASARAL